MNLFKELYKKGTSGKHRLTNINIPNKTKNKIHTPSVSPQACKHAFTNIWNKLDAELKNLKA